MPTPLEILLDPVSLAVLTAVEFGYLGIATLALLLLRPLADATRCAFRAGRGDVRGDLLLGLGVALLICYLHSTLEWVWRATNVAYVFWTFVALVGALAGAVRNDTLIGSQSPDRRPST